jgi:membrane-associated phospholipid phosphatase
VAASPSHFWSTLLHAVYFAYTSSSLPRDPPGRKQRTGARSSWWPFLFHLCFLLLPRAPITIPRPTGPFVENWAAALVYATLARGCSYGAAFPSSHVAATVAATIGTWLGSRVAGTLLIIPTLLLTVGVVYCQMHYAVDTLAGLLVPLPITALILRARTTR